MKFSRNPGALRKFRETAWEYQGTFETPLINLKPFVAAIVSAIPQLKSGCVTIEAVVFEPLKLIEFLESLSLPPQYEHGVSLTVGAPEEVQSLLEVIFSEWIDFICIPETESFVIYADHDEFTTCFAHTQANLDRVIRILGDGGFTMIADYERRL